MRITVNLTNLHVALVLDTCKISSHMDRAAKFTSAGQRTYGKMKKGLHINFLNVIECKAYTYMGRTKLSQATNRRM